MAELVAAVVVVCLPSLKSLVHHGASMSSSAKRSAAATSRTGNSHIKLSSGRDPYLVSSHRTGPIVVSSAGAGGLGDDTSSDVELNSLEHRHDVIYKSHRVSVTYAKPDDMI